MVMVILSLLVTIYIHHMNEVRSRRRHETKEGRVVPLSQYVIAFIGLSFVTVGLVSIASSSVPGYASFDVYGIITVVFGVSFIIMSWSVFVPRSKTRKSDNRSR
ncbi:MAG: hypothetical protein JSW25_02215 [Thermoplasmata archaeon]|nr:MAG: hypothetical protein JSW25_02215 [Thermoplasmata archaeon]